MAAASPEASSSLQHSSEGSTTATAVPVPRAPQRQSSIRFTDDTTTLSRSPMSRPRQTSSDEITPIRQAEGGQDRNYNTTNAENAKTSGSETATTSSSKPQSDGSKNEEDKLPWYKRIAEKYGSVSLENKGSVARDHLALERTFLAWLRTSLAFASIGIAITQLFRLNTTIASRSQRYEAAIPFSPFVGQSIPIELVPYLSQAAASALPSLGPTLLDQLMLLPAPGSDSSISQLPPSTQAEFDEHAAARLRHVGKPLGATFLAISVVILFIGFHRYFESQHWIIRGKFPASRGSIFLVGFIAGALIVASLVVVLVIGKFPCLVRKADPLSGIPPHVFLHTASSQRWNCAETRALHFASILTIL